MAGPAAEVSVTYPSVVDAATGKRLLVRVEERNRYSADDGATWWDRGQTAVVASTRGPEYAVASEVWTDLQGLTEKQRRDIVMGALRDLGLALASTAAQRGRAELQEVTELLARALWTMARPGVPSSDVTAKPEDNVGNFNAVVRRASGEIGDS